ncbi:amino acid ABC transporter substrate-binding protein, PAAT family [Desulforamulus reducens MI-1]|uniref:Amino acid ABC transporter substrate-binding protein, PAAT family n=1 Tax=Desulforamulus reducens (strain ATCC BAA-1160 / DSM 100696 / MI-1) TaxID=349161 RepID=A4J4A4_DESRM|nr:amino acid ABC transporter substrate-binding protein [Desulforamulus reducens]ABO49907.1 amino acid ABC transporter substrate-binding protein, PAAT family [Desulforamulus reducens MI-1]
MKKRGLWFLVLVLTLALVTMGCGGGEKEKQAANQEPAKQTEKNTLDQIKEKGVIVAGLDDTFAPMGYRDESNKLVGFDIDMGEEMAKRLGVKIQWQPTQWDGIIMALDSKRFDIILSGMTVTEERKKSINFSVPYVGDGQIMVVKKGTTGFNTAADLKGKVVGTQAGSSGEEAVKKVEGIKEVKLYKTYPEAFTDLQIGRIPVVVCDRITASHYISKRADTYEIVGEKITDEPLAIGLRKSDPELKEAIDNVLNEMKKDGTLTKISMKWFNRDITVK